MVTAQGYDVAIPDVQETGYVELICVGQVFIKGAEAVAGAAHNVDIEQAHEIMPDLMIFHHLSKIFCMLNETFFTFNKYVKQHIMKEITLKIPDKKLGFFMELMKELGFEIRDEIEIPEEQQEEVNKRLKLIDSGEMSTCNWNEAEKEIFRR
ncbi:hypothetical protein BH23BAC3_BH23BAC3_25390 [soil metagenome]